MRKLLMTLAAVAFMAVPAHAAWLVKQSSDGTATIEDADGDVVVGRITDDGVGYLGGVDTITICGDATTVNNNTVYYGPDRTLQFSSTSSILTMDNGLACDINAAGNATEATADAPVFASTSFYATGMTCRNEGDANADISFTLRTAAGATTPSVTCTIPDGNRDCVADVQATAEVAAGATVAVAVASTGNIADGNGFVCTVPIAY